MTLLATLLVMLLLLFAKGFFSGSEIALISADRVRLRSRAARGDSGSKLALRLIGNPPRLLTTTLLGTNTSSVALTTIGTIVVIGLLGGSGELVALILFTPIFLILGEIVPKSVYQQKADMLVPIIAVPLNWLQTAFGPVVALFSRLAQLVAKLIGGPGDAETGLREQFLAAVQMAETTGMIAAFRRGQVRRVLRFAQMQVGEVMYPIASVTRLPEDAPMETAVAQRRATGQRLIPLYRDDPERVTGIAVLESWDLMDPRLAERRLVEFRGAVAYVGGEEQVAGIIERLHESPRLTLVVTDGEGRACGLITLSLLVRGALGSTVDPATDRTSLPALNRPD